MNKQKVVIILLITCALGVHADDSIKVSASDLKALIERVERLERKDSLSQEMGTRVESQESKDNSRKSKDESSRRISHLRHSGVPVRVIHVFWR